MSVELFDVDEDPSTTLVLAIYNDGRDIIPCWWLEILEQKYYDIEEIKALLDCIPNVVKQLEKVLEHFS
jgi:hypothetical protein